jgi:hypothetical protein
MGHANPSITLGIYTHLFEDDHEPAMSALGAISRPAADTGNPAANALHSESQLAMNAFADVRK